MGPNVHSITGRDKVNTEYHPSNRGVDWLSFVEEETFHKKEKKERNKERNKEKI